MQNQPWVTASLRAIDWFDGTDKSNTMSWLEQVEVVAERNNQAPSEVGMAKLKGAPLCDVHKTQFNLAASKKITNRKLFRYPICI